MRSGSVSLSANGRAFLFWFLECPCIPNGRAGKGKARPAAWRGRDNRVEGVNLGGNRAPARGRNRNSRPEPTPQAALAGFLGPAGMSGGSTGFGKRQERGERASARRSPALSIAQSETGTQPGSQDHVSPKHGNRSFRLGAAKEEKEPSLPSFCSAANVSPVVKRAFVAVGPLLRNLLVNRT